MYRRYSRYEGVVSHRWKNGASCTELWCHNIKEVDCLAARRPHEKQSGDYYVPIFGRLFGAGAYSAPKVPILGI